MVLFYVATGICKALHPRYLQGDDFWKRLSRRRRFSRFLWVTIRARVNKVGNISLKARHRLLSRSLHRLLWLPSRTSSLHRCLGKVTKAGQTFTCASCRGSCHYVCKWTICASGWMKITTSANCIDCAIHLVLSCSYLVGGGGCCSCMLLLHLLPTALMLALTFAPCALFPLLWTGANLHRWRLSPVATCATSAFSWSYILAQIVHLHTWWYILTSATCAGGALASSHWRNYCTCTRATCTVWW